RQAVPAPSILQSEPAGQCSSIRHGTHRVPRQYGVAPPQAGAQPPPPSSRTVTARATGGALGAGTQPFSQSQTNPTAQAGLQSHVVVPLPPPHPAAVRARRIDTAGAERLMLPGSLADAEGAHLAHRADHAAGAAIVRIGRQVDALAGAIGQ